ncbi:hypothetical protein IAR55_005261 [Kwoniella newhampshirensis]|uniref:Mob1 family protein n=1 Tax=Kwoniella newhampshirensis TaxID=1651941 RepID=A0AAW0YVC6_9TREE
MIIPSAQQQAEGSAYRLKRGTKLSDIPPIPPTPPVPSLSSLNGPFQLAEYLALKIRHDPHDIEGLVEVPSGDGSVGGKGPERDVWIYEHLRRIPIDLTPLLTSLLPICTRETCPQMKADEWLYLCVAHGGGGTEECCAIDYILHTVDSTTALLNSSKNFPSRMQIPSASLTHFPSLFRRLSRIFSHAYFHHRETFSLAESETSLYARFVGLCERYELVGPGLLVIPREVVGRFGSNNDEEEAEDDVDDDDDDDDDDGGEEGSDEEQDGTRGRGEGEGGSTSGEKRPHSLDRHPYPQAVKGTTSQPANETSAVGAATVGRGTLGRGKQPRATMMWGGASDVPALPETSSEGEADDALAKTQAQNRARSESIESAVYIPTSDQTQVQDNALENLVATIPRAASDEDEIEELDTVEEEDEGVPKDEIDLLEEEGKLAPASDVAPLVDPASATPSAAVEGKTVTTEGTSKRDEEEEGDGMEEVRLDDEPKSSGETEMKEEEDKIPSTVKATVGSPAGGKSGSTQKQSSPSKGKKSPSKNRTSPVKGKGKSPGTPSKGQTEPAEKKVDQTRTASTTGTESDTSAVEGEQQGDASQKSVVDTAK